MEKDNKKTSFDLWSSTIHPEDKEPSIDAVKEYAANGKELNVEYRTCLPDGSIHWLMSRGKPQLTTAAEQFVISARLSI